MINFNYVVYRKAISSPAGTFPLAGFKYLVDAEEFIDNEIKKGNSREDYTLFRISVHETEMSRMYT